MINMINIAVYLYKLLRRVNPKNFHYKEKYFSISLIL